jgi:hypothetical protein
VNTCRGSDVPRRSVVSGSLSPSSSPVVVFALGVSSLVDASGDALARAAETAALRSSAGLAPQKLNQWWGSSDNAP